MPNVVNARVEVKRYYRLGGIDIGESSHAAVRVKVGGFWSWVPKSVIHGSTKKIGAAGEDEIVIDEWFARDRGWL